MNNVKIQKLFTILVVLLPFLYQYRSPISVISFGEFILLPFMVYFLIKNFSTKVKYKEFNGLYTYFFVAILFNFIASLQTYYSYKEFITVFARIAYYALLIYIAYHNFDFKYGIKVLIGTSLFFSLYVLLQRVVYHSVNIYLPTVISPNLVFPGEESGNRLDYANYYRWSYRPSSLFLEPGYFISYAAPALLALLYFEDINRKKMIIALIITVGFVASTSSAAIIVLGVAWGFFILKNLYRKDGKVETKRLMLLLLIVLFMFILLLSPLATTLIQRTSTGGSFNNRITRAFILFQNTNLFQKFTGVGINNIANFVNETGSYTIYDEKDLNFVSSYIGTLLASGIFTFIFYNKYLITLYCRNKQTYTKLLVLIFLFYNFIENMVFTYRFAFYTILILGAQKFYKKTTE